MFLFSVATATNPIAWRSPLSKKSDRTVGDQLVDDHADGGRKKQFVSQLFPVDCCRIDVAVVPQDQLNDFRLEETDLYPRTKRVPADAISAAETTSILRDQCNAVGKG